MLSIKPFSPSRAEDFRRLNVEWLERYFVIEPFDEQVLGQPQQYVLDAGGDILFAALDDEIVGTCALMCHGEDRFELTKMAVTEAVQGRGIGRFLLQAAIARYHSLGGTSLFLETHSSLGAALRLYERAGFVHAQRPVASKYARSDVYMEWRPAK